MHHGEDLQKKRKLFHLVPFINWLDSSHQSELAPWQRHRD